MAAAEVSVNRQGGFNSSLLFVWALKRLYASAWSMLPNDKDGSWSIMSVAVRRALYRDAVSGRAYIPICEGEIDADRIRKSYNKLLYRVVDATEGDADWVMRLRKSWTNGNLCAKLRLLIKSHKVQGEVSMRAVHATIDWSLEGMAR